MTIIYADPPPEEVRTPCPRCFGTGEVVSRSSTVYTRAGLVLDVKRCPSCHGDGYLVATRGVSIVPLIPAIGKRRG